MPLSDERVAAKPQQVHFIRFGRTVQLFVADCAGHQIAVEMSAHDRAMLRAGLDEIDAYFDRHSERR